MKTILLSGCSSGVGRAAALRFASEGHRVIAAVRRQRDADDLLNAAGGGLECVLMDIADDRSVADCSEMLDIRDIVPDVLINNAGVPCLGSMEELRVTDLRAAFEVNVIGALRLYQSVVPGMRTRKNGQVINVSSSLGAGSLPLYGGYSASKFALEAMSEAMYYELAPFGVHVNVLRPGIVITPFRARKEEQRAERVPADSPYATRLDNPSPPDLMQRVSTPAQVAAVLLQMVEDPARCFRWTCGLDGIAWITARRRLDDAEFANYVTRRGYGAEATDDS